MNNGSPLTRSVILYFFLLLVGQSYFLHAPEPTANAGQNPFRPAAVDDGGVNQESQDAFRTGSPTHDNGISTYGSWLMRIALLQQKLKLKMTRWVGDVKRGETFHPLMMLLLVSFGYGAVHAAGPGHGKAVSTSYILSCKPSLQNGLLFGSLIALFHGLSGVVCVMGLHFILRKGFSNTLNQVSDVTQVVSYGLITLLGTAILVTHIREYFRSGKQIEEKKGAFPFVETTKRRLIFWAFIVGMVPCPGVVTVMLFCLSMGLPLLGVFLATAISMGMAFTLSLTVIMVMMGKAGTVFATSQKNRQRIELVTGVLSGGCIAALGLILFMTALHG